MGKKIRMGFVGIRRANAFLKPFEENQEVEIVAFCDLIEENAKGVAKEFNAEVFTDYTKMLEQASLDAVTIATPMQFHAQQSIEALIRNIHVLCEVTAAVDLDQAKSLVAAAHSSKAVYMMAENYCYTKPNVMVKEISNQGIFGDLYYAEAEYIHELKKLNEKTPWRRKWQTGINGCTYGTHSLGPILQCFQGHRVVSVSCVGSGHHYKDAKDVDFEQEDTTIMLCRMSNGGLVKIRLDMLSDRPHAMTNYSLQGTCGAYESARVHKDEESQVLFEDTILNGASNKVWLKQFYKGLNRWDRLEEYEERFLPDKWKKLTEAAQKAGHGGGDYFEIRDFVDSITGKKECPIGIHEAMDMTLPGLISQESIKKNSQWLDVPNSRDWV